MKTLVAFPLFTGLCYNALASVTINPETNKSTQLKQENPKQINASKMTLPFFSLLTLAISADSLKNATQNMLFSPPNIIDPRRFEYRITNR
jgi:hypothetical protein